MIPALKAMTARFTGNETWALTRPPLTALSGSQVASLMADLETIGFDIATNGDCVTA